MTIFFMIGNDNKTLLAMTIGVPSLRACRSNLFFTIFYKFLADTGQRAAVNQIDCHLERCSPCNDENLIIFSDGKIDEGLILKSKSAPKTLIKRLRIYF